MKVLKLFFKIICAGLAAVLLLSLIVAPYSLHPVHIANPRENTDYVWTANSLWSTMEEGMAFGRFDANGFNNRAVIDDPDIIVVGSSHMEAVNVGQDQNAAALLGKLLDGKLSVYNLGISGHDVYKVCQYLPKNLELYAPKYAVVETSDVNLTMEHVQAALEGRVEFTPSHSTGLVAMLQKIPCLRLLYHQMESGLLKLFMPRTAGTPKGVPVETVDNDACSLLFTHLSELEEKYGTEIIFVYHPNETLHEDGSISFDGGEYLTAFASFAEANGITFVDLTEPFTQMYYGEHHVPHGFSTGKLGMGHLNQYGHRAMAQALYEAIAAMEGV